MLMLIITKNSQLAAEVTRSVLSFRKNCRQLVGPFSQAESRRVGVDNKDELFRSSTAKNLIFGANF